MHRSQLAVSLLATLALALAASHSSAQTLTALYSFDGSSGQYPGGDVTLSGSTLYGMTTQGGANNQGTIFSIPAAGGSPTLLGSLSYAIGVAPYGSLTLTGSTLYGMTLQGGAYGDGAIFSIPATGGTPTNLVSFNYATTGSDPYGSLTLGGSTLYGMTNGGGANNGGTVFSLDGVVVPTPEPSSLVLLGLGTIGLGATALRRRMRNRVA